MNRFAKNFLKLVGAFSLVLIICILGVQFSTTSHTFVAIDDFSITVNEDTPTLETITNRIYPIKHAAQFPEIAANFTFALSSVTSGQITHVPFNVSGDSVAQLNLTMPTAGSQSFVLNVTDKNNATLTATKTIPVTVTATDSEAFFTQTTSSLQFAEDTAAQ